MSISRLTTDSTVVERTPRLVAGASSDDVHISLQVSSSGTVTQNGRTVWVKPGSITVYATDAPYHQDYSRPSQQQLILQMSRSGLGLPPDLLNAACQRLRVPGSSGVNALFSFIPEALELRENGGLPSTISDLAAAMIRSSFSTGTVLPRTQQGLLATIHAYLNENFTSPELTAEGLAAQHHISRRRLYQLFEDQDENPGEIIRRKRIEKAAELLSKADPAKQSIGDIAALCGLPDLTTFSRAFRRIKGMAPRDYRSLLTTTGEQGLNHN